MKLDVRSLLGRAKGVFEMSKKLATVMTPLLLLAGQEAEAQTHRNETFSTWLVNPNEIDFSAGLNLGTEFNLSRHIKIFGQAGIHNKFKKSETVATFLDEEADGKRWVKLEDAASNRVTLRGGLEIGIPKLSAVGEIGIMHPLNSPERVKTQQAFAGLKTQHAFGIGDGSRALSVSA
jgi:hypothetical protein